ncbi:hypothetical protein [Actinoplanes sp. HUAS TT8]|uniref:hypothetical protein n=1 Tax=Actinoplanes sp. HUAS TT8 TaxID=3447453 RepID=UPI003F523749
MKINATDHSAFSAAAAAAGMTVDKWLTEAGRQRALTDLITGSQPGSRVLHVPLDPSTAATLDAEADRAGTIDWVYATRCLRDLFTAPAVDPEQLWADVVAVIGVDIASAQQRAHLEQVVIDTIVGDTVLLVVPDAYTRDVIELRLRPTIQLALSRHLHRPVQVAVTIGPDDRAGRVQPAPTGRRRTREDDLRRVRQLVEELAAQFAVAADGPPGSHTVTG